MTTDRNCDTCRYETRQASEYPCDTCAPWSDMPNDSGERPSWEAKLNSSSPNPNPPTRVNIAQGRRVREALKRLREERGVSLTEMGKRINRNRNYVRRIEDATVETKLWHLVLYAEHLDVNISMVLDPGLRWLDDGGVL